MKMSMPDFTILSTASFFTNSVLYHDDVHTMSTTAIAPVPVTSMLVRFRILRASCLSPVPYTKLMSGLAPWPNPTTIILNRYAVYPTIVNAVTPSTPALRMMTKLNALMLMHMESSPMNSELPLSIVSRNIALSNANNANLNTRDFFIKYHTESARLTIAEMSDAYAMPCMPNWQGPANT